MLQQPVNVTEGLELLKAKLAAKQELEAEIEDLKLFLSDRISPYKPGEITVKKGYTYTNKQFRVQGTTLQIWGSGKDVEIKLLVFGQVIHKNGNESRDNWTEPAAPHFEKVLQQEKELNPMTAPIQPGCVFYDYVGERFEVVSIEYYKS